MWQRVRRAFVTGFVVTVPLFVTWVAIVSLFRFADALTAGLSERLFGVRIPGIGVLATALILLAIGALATNVIGRRLLQRGEKLLLRVPIFRTVYSPLKQITAAFAPDNELGFKRVVLIEDAAGGPSRMGFLTREFDVDYGRGPEPRVAVYVPTNHLYLGDVVVCPPHAAVTLDLTVEQGVRAFLTGGVSLPARVKGRRAGPA